MGERLRNNAKPSCILLHLRLCLLNSRSHVCVCVCLYAFYGSLLHYPYTYRGWVLLCDTFYVIGFILYTMVKDVTFMKEGT